MKEVLAINDALILCVAQAGKKENKGVMPLRRDVRRATAMESHTDQMHALLDKAYKLPIKLPRLAEFEAAYADLTAQAKLARQISDAKDSLDVPYMQALVARAESYEIKGELVEELLARCNELLRQLPLRRLLQTAAFCDGVTDCREIVARVSDVGTLKAEVWLLLDGPKCWDAAVRRLEQLDEEQKEKKRAIANVTKQMLDLECSTDAAAIQAILVQGMAYNIKDEVVDRLRQRHDTLQRQLRRRRELVECASYISPTDVEKVLATMREERLDLPATWLLPDGPRLVAWAKLLLLELELGQRSLPCSLGESKDKCQEMDLPTEQEELDLLKVYRDWEVSAVRSMLDVPIARLVASEELSQRLVEHCEKLQKQLPAHRSLQICAVSQSLEDIQARMAQLRADNLGTPEGWILPDGPRLLEPAARRQEELLEQRQADAEKVAELETRAEKLSSSLDVSGMENCIGNLEAYSVKGDQVEALKQRHLALRTQLPLRLELQGCTVCQDFEAARGVVRRARDAGLETPDEWLLPDGPGAFEKAVKHLDDVAALKARIDGAVSMFDVRAMQIAFEQADELGIPPSQIAEPLKLFKSLQDKAIVREKIAELCGGEKGDSTDKQVSNLQALIADNEPFDTSPIAGVDRARLTEVMESMQMRESGFPVQITCAAFLRTYLVLVPAKERACILTGAGSTNGRAATAETDLKKAARALVEGFPKAIVGDGLIAKDAIVSGTKVFMTSGLHRTLEHAHSRCCAVPAVKIQSVWRGRRARAALSMPLKEAMEVNKSLRVFTEEGKFRTNLESAKTVEQGLSDADDLLRRAVRLQLRLPLLEEYAKVRGQIASQSKLARQIEDQQASLSAPGMEAAVARAAVCGMEGPLVDALTKRSELLRMQLRHRQMLRGSAVERLAEVEKSIAEARSAGLESSDNWLLPEGPDCWSEALSKCEKLREEKRIQDELKERIEAAAARCDLKDLYAAFERADVLDMPPVHYQEAYELFLRLHDPSFVKGKLADVQGREDCDPAEVQLNNLLKLVEEPETFDTSEWANVDRVCLTAVMDSMYMRESGFPIQIRCADFLRLYLVLVPAPERAGIITGAGSTSEKHATAETDFTKGALALIERLPNSVIGDDAKFKNVTIDGAKVFTTSTLHRALENALHRCCVGPAVKIQSVQRGRRARATLSAPLKEAIGVNKALHEKMTDGAFKTSLVSAKNVEDCLKATDDLLRQAVKLEIKLPRLDAYAKARGELAAQARLARQIEDQNASLSSPAMEASLAQAAACGMVGPLVDKLAERSRQLRGNLDLRQQLRMCEFSESPRFVEQTLALGADATWLLLDGPGCVSAAQARLERLQKEQATRSAAIAELDQEIRGAESSGDVRVIQALINRSEFLGMTGELVDRLRGRCEALRQQIPICEDLQRCTALSSMEPVAEIIARTKALELDHAKNWLLPDGPKLLARAQRWLKRLEQEQQALNDMTLRLQGQTSALAYSLDHLAMQELASRAERAGVGKKFIEELRGRCDALRHQEPLCEALRRLDTKSVASAQAAGLGPQPTGWLLPDGPHLLARTLAWQAWQDEMQNLPNVNGMAFGEEQQTIAVALLNCLSSENVGDVSRAVAEAKSAGLDSPRNWPEPGGRIIFAAAESRLEHMEEQQYFLRNTSADLEWQVCVLSSLLDSPYVRPLLGEAIAEALAKQLGAVQKELPQRRALRLCAVHEGRDALEKTIADVKSAGLEAPEAWLLPEGPSLFLAATRRLQNLTAQDQANEEAVGEVERQLEELKSSLNVPAMQGALARAENCAARQDLVEAVVRRRNALLQQMPLMQRLTSCGVMEVLEDVQKTIADVRAAGLHTPEGWLLPDGPKLFGRAVARQQQLQEVESVKADIAVALDKLDAKELQRTISIATELGVPQTEYAEAHAMFLRLQDGAFVLKKTQELKKSCSSDPLYALMVSNLAEQLDLLGLKVDSAGMEEVRKSMVLERERTRTKSVFDSRSAISREVGQKCCEVLANFGRLRDPVEWCTRGLAEGSSEEDGFPREVMLEHTADPIVASLTELDAERESEALASFADVQRFMGDKAMPTAFEGDMSEAVLAAARVHPSLRDEVYLQIMKQVTRNPSSKSCAAGYDLLQKLLNDGKPNEELSDFLRAFLQKHTEPGDEDPEVGMEDEEGDSSSRKRSPLAQMEMRSSDYVAQRKAFLLVELPRLASATLALLLERRSTKRNSALGRSL